MHVGHRAGGWSAHHSWLSVLLVTCVLFCTDVHGMELPAIHWNSSNPMFKTSNNDHVIQVNLYDGLDFVCPVSDNGEVMPEYYVIYQVSKREYDDCNLYDKPRMKIMNCSNPNQRRRFTLLFVPFVAIPDTPEFRSGLTYYYITTSTGNPDGMSNEQQGACLYRNMKLTIRVCCESTTISPPVNLTTQTQVPSITMTTTGEEPVTEGVGSADPATTTTISTTTRRRTIPTRRPHPVRTTTTVGNSIHHTDKEWDRTSPDDEDSKSVDKETDNEDENDINKDNHNNDPKQDSLVNSAVTRTLTPGTGLSCGLALLLLSWLLPWRHR